MLLFALVVAFAAAGCGRLPHMLSGARVAGEVVDADTGRPIAGAHVALVWESTIRPRGFTGHNARTICYHAAAAVTDTAGRFDIEPWREWSTYDVSDADPSALVYAAGYVPIERLTRDPAANPRADTTSERYAMKPFAGSVDERMHMLFWGLANRGCAYGGDSQRALYPMLKAIYEEARRSASSPEQIEQLESFALEAAYAALAFDPRGRGDDTQVKAFIREELK
jgi:hypothetical protein